MKCNGYFIEPLPNISYAKFSGAVVVVIVW
jgi:hypothetical protein